jgi:alkyl hydroperoxide reductase subunit F
MNDRYEIIVDAECNTNVPGLFAAGDVSCLKEKQVVVSVGEGAKAALSAVLYLEELRK